MALQHKGTWEYHCHSNSSSSKPTKFDGLGRITKIKIGSKQRDSKGSIWTSVFNFQIWKLKRDKFNTHLNSNPPTLTSTNHVPIAMFIYMMHILISPYVENYNKINQKLPMLIMDKVLRINEKGQLSWTPLSYDE